MQSAIQVVRAAGESLIVAAGVVEIFSVLLEAKTRKTDVRLIQRQLDSIIVGDRVPVDRKLLPGGHFSLHPEVFGAARPAVAHPVMLAKLTGIAAHGDPANSRREG